MGSVGRRDGEWAASSSWGPNRIDTFARGDDKLWHQAFAGQWYGWESLGAPSGGFTGDPAAVSWSSGRIDVFAHTPPRTGLRPVYVETLAPGSAGSRVMNWTPDSCEGLRRPAPTPVLERQLVELGEARRRPVLRSRRGVVGPEPHRRVHPRQRQPALAQVLRRPAGRAGNRSVAASAPARQCRAGDRIASMPSWSAPAADSGTSGSTERAGTAGNPSAAHRPPTPTPFPGPGTASTSSPAAATTSSGTTVSTPPQPEPPPRQRRRSRGWLARS